MHKTKRNLLNQNTHNSSDYESNCSSISSSSSSSTLSAKQANNNNNNSNFKSNISNSALNDPADFDEFVHQHHYHSQRPNSSLRSSLNNSKYTYSSTAPQHQQHFYHQHHRDNSILSANNTIGSINLEDYIHAMEQRPTTNEHTSEMDIWAQLQQKESDILLAAELGKALLEKNQELVKQQEKLIEDYSTKLEKLEQEKHMLRQKLSIAVEESDQRVLELQSDLNELKDKLTAQEIAIRQAEKEKTLLIDELTNQNTRLTDQVQEAHTTEMKLITQMQELKDQYNYKYSTFQEHKHSLESLKNELDLTAQKRQDLEKRLKQAVDEKESLTMALEEASDRIHMLERHAREQETKLENTLQTLERSQRENNVLSERLGADANSNAPGKKSLQFEMECDEDDSSYSDGKPNQMWVEARSVYIQLKSLVDSLKISHDDDSGLNSDISLDLESMDNTISSTAGSGGRSSQCSEAVEFRQGMLSAMSDELTRLLLNLDAGNFKKMLDQTRNLVLEQEDEIKRSHQHIQQLESKLTVTEVELQNVKEERNQARADLATNSDRDELLIKAQTERDAANDQRTKAEVELAKTQVDLMQTNSQLLESIQQKVELSQQLEQWQMDMAELINEQLRSKILSSSRKVPAVTSAPSSASSAAAALAKRISSYKLWTLFQR